MGKTHSNKTKFKMGKKVRSADCVRGYALGLNKGFVVTKNSERTVRHTQRRGKMTDRIALVTSTVKTVAGMSPYEKRALEMFKVGNAKLDKRAAKFLKKRLGTWNRANRKKTEIRNLLKAKKK